MKKILQITGAVIACVGLTIPFRVILAGYVTTDGQAIASMCMIMLGGVLIGVSFDIKPDPK